MDQMPTISAPARSSPPPRILVGRLLWRLMMAACLTAFYVLQFLLRILWVKDQRTTKSGSAGLELWPRKLAMAKFSLDQMKAAKKSVPGGIVKSLLACPKIHASATNSHGDKPLDIGVKSKEKLKKLKMDTTVAELLVNALREEGAQTAKELGRNNWVAEKRGSLMVVASLIATMAFQAGLTPPGGLFQDNTEKHNAGKSVLAVASRKGFFIFFHANTMGFLGSLSVILLLISELPFNNNFFMWGLTVILWWTITSVAYTYALAVATMTPVGAASKQVRATLDTWIYTWISIMGILLLIHTIRICLRLRKAVSKKMFGSGERNVSNPADGASVQQPV